ncbi:MAG: hypothetical protein ABI091_11620, partial [Ferruginibacter sp.]
MNAIKTIKILIFIASSFICIKAHCQKSQSDKEINLKSIEKYQKVIYKTTHQIDSISRIRLKGTYDANQANPVNNKVDFIQKTITSDSSLTDTKKIAFLRGLSESLNAFAYALRSGEMIPGQYLPLADAYEKAM